MGCGRPVKPRSLFLATVYVAGVLACISSANVNAAVVLLDNFDSGTATDGGIGGGLFAQVVGSADLVGPSITFTKTSGNPEFPRTPVITISATSSRIYPWRLASPRPPPGR